MSIEKEIRNVCTDLYSREYARGFNPFEGMSLYKLDYAGHYGSNFGFINYICHQKVLFYFYVLS